MYLEHLVPAGLAALFSPRCFIRRLMQPELVSFGLLANLNALGKRGVFREVDAIVDVGEHRAVRLYGPHSATPFADLQLRA